MVKAENTDQWFDSSIIEFQVFYFSLENLLKTWTSFLFILWAELELELLLSWCLQKARIELQLSWIWARIELESFASNKKMRSDQSHFQILNTF